MKLFTIGDSLSQGFMSGAAARTDLSFSTLIADALKTSKYNYPEWPKGGHPLNIEQAFRVLERRFGDDEDIRGPFEWTRALSILNSYMDNVEDYYEREGGNDPNFKSFFHNVAVRGFDLSSAWQVNPELCSKLINQSRNSSRDNFPSVVDQSFLRTARTVLRAGSKGNQNFSQLDWLNHHHKEEGVENLILFLGANNALGTVLSLNINQTSRNGTAFKDGPESVSYETRRDKGWNLWHPDDFRVEYRFTLNRVKKILQSNPDVDYKVFVATIPLVTIAPLIKAVGAVNERQQVEVTEYRMDNVQAAPKSKAELPKAEKIKYSYAKYYTYFPFADSFDIEDPHLNFRQILHIDNCIRTYNRIIQEEVMAFNKSLNARKVYIVDVGTILSKMALKRNNLMPPYEYPEYFDFVYPRIDTRYYGTTRDGKIMSGGIFSLDGVHPSAIGQGLLAYEFLKVMNEAGSFDGDPEKALNWDAIFESDSLYNDPIGLLNEIYDNAKLARWMLGKLS